MCGPGCEKTDKELASNLRAHLKFMVITTQSLQERGYSVIFSLGSGYVIGSPKDVKITKTIKNEVTL